MHQMPRQSDILGINHMSLEDKSRRARRSPSPLGPGGAPASPSSCSQPASSLRYLNALEEAWSEEQELEATSHSMSLQESVGHLVLLIDSFNKGEPHSLQLSKVGKGAKQEDPSKACSTTACRQIGEHNRVDFPTNKQQQQLEQQKQKPLQEGQLRTADLSSEQKLEQRGENKRRGTKACITRSAAYPSQPQQGEPNRLLRRRWCRTEAPQTTSLETTQPDATTACNKNSLGIGAQQRPPKRPWRILVDTGAELSVAPKELCCTHPA